MSEQHSSADTPITDEPDIADKDTTISLTEQLVADIRAVNGVKNLFSNSGLVKLFSHRTDSTDLIRISPNEVTVCIGIEGTSDPRKVAAAVVDVVLKRVVDAQKLLLETTAPTTEKATKIRFRDDSKTLSLFRQIDPEQLHVDVTISDIGRAILPQPNHQD